MILSKSSHIRLPIPTFSHSHQYFLHANESSPAAQSKHLPRMWLGCHLKPSKNHVHLPVEDHPMHGLMIYLESASRLALRCRGDVRGVFLSSLRVSLGIQS